LNAVFPEENRILCLFQDYGISDFALARFFRSPAATQISLPVSAWLAACSIVFLHRARFSKQ